MRPSQEKREGGACAREIGRLELNRSPSGFQMMPDLPASIHWEGNVLGFILGDREDNDSDVVINSQEEYFPLCQALHVPRLSG